jgi:hypothetical protein
MTLVFQLAFPHADIDEVTKRNLYIRIGHAYPKSINYSSVTNLSERFVGDTGDSVVGTLCDIDFEGNTTNAIEFDFVLGAEQETHGLDKIGLVIDHS